LHRLIGMPSLNVVNLRSILWLETVALPFY